MLIPVPNPGDLIYIGDSHDLWGGLAEVTDVRIEIIGERRALLVSVKEAPGSGEYDWLALIKRQAHLKAEYGQRRARAYRMLECG